MWTSIAFTLPRRRAFQGPDDSPVLRDRVLDEWRRDHIAPVDADHLDAVTGLRVDRIDVGVAETADHRVVELPLHASIASPSSGWRSLHASAPRPRHACG